MKAGYEGIIGERKAVGKLLELGFPVFEKTIDVDAVDLLIRYKKGKNIFYKEIQVKYSKFYTDAKSYWFTINGSTFQARKNYAFMFVCGDEKHIFILSSKDMKLHLKKMLWHENGNKWMIYVIERKNKWYFRTKSDEDNIDITEHLNDFDQLTQ
jgi:hypothetical protein